VVYFGFHGPYSKDLYILKTQNGKYIDIFARRHQITVGR
jgi:hypothetical protein